MAEINLLRKQEAELLHLKDLKFKTEKEFQIFYQKNKEKFDLLKDVQHRIKELEWSIKSPQQRENVRLEKIKLAQKFQEINSKNSYRNIYVEIVTILYEELLKCNSTQKDLIYFLATLLCDMEKKPFATIDIKESLTERFKELLKENSIVLYDKLILLSEAK